MNPNLAKLKIRVFLEFHYTQMEVSDRGPDHVNHRIVALVTKRRLFTALHCIWESVEATPAFILTHFVANILRGRSTQILVSELLRTLRYSFYG
jgi:hypothetical protein